VTTDSRSITARRAAASNRVSVSLLKTALGDMLRRQDAAAQGRGEDAQMVSRFRDLSSGRSPRTPYLEPYFSPPMVYGPGCRIDPTCDAESVRRCAARSVMRTAPPRHASPDIVSWLQHDVERHHRWKRKQSANRGTPDTAPVRLQHLRENSAAR
jgi:hypothetical protein